ncbi:hypothetical protein CKJ76_26155 [Mycobacterium avium]|nr:hypothetical protein CKJ76_26155 [Mycobacterium avium]
MHSGVISALDNFLDVGAPFLLAEQPGSVDEYEHLWGRLGAPDRSYSWRFAWRCTLRDQGRNSPERVLGSGSRGK